MAKLFEEVVSGNVGSAPLRLHLPASTADIIIHFGPPCFGPPAAASNTTRCRELVVVNCAVFALLHVLISRQPQAWTLLWNMCETTQGPITIEVDPDQSPEGARRFLDLVRDGFYSDQAIFKAVRGFVAQFGISDNNEMNEKWSPTIPDDERKTASFPKGTIILTASRQNSRSTQVSVALADLTGRLGQNPWETAIGHVVEKDMPVLDRIFTGYADAVDEQELLRQGNSYLREFYPRLDFVKACSVPGETALAAVACDAKCIEASPSSGVMGCGTSPARRSGPASQSQAWLRAPMDNSTWQWQPGLAMHSSSPMSPHRTTRSGWMHGTGNEQMHVAGQMSLRCHSLLLRTQPVLLDRLLAQQDCRFGHAMADAQGSVATTSIQLSALPAKDFAALPDPVQESPEAVVDVQGSVDTSSARGASVDRCSGAPAQVEAVNSPRTAPAGPVAEKPVEVTVDDEPEVFLEMIKFVYLNTCHVDQSNVKALLHIADKYCIEDIVKHCLQWMQDQFTAGLFYHMLTVQMSNEHFGRLLWNSLLKALRSRRHFSLVTADAEEHFEKLPVSFVEALLSSDELPVVSEIEVIHLIARWAKGALARQERKIGSHYDELERNSHEDGHDGHDPEDNEGHDGGSDKKFRRVAVQMGSAPVGSDAVVPRACRRLRLMRAVRKSNMLVRLADMEPMFQILGLNRLFCSKPPRETSALDPGFVAYRGMLELMSLRWQAWKGISVSLGSHDFLQQQEGFKPNQVPERGTTVFPRLWVRITCSSWSHREKRTSKSTSGHNRHTVAGPLGAEIPGPPNWESVPTHLMGISPVNEEPCSKFPPTLKTMQSQDDWDIGRTKTLRAPNNMPELMNNEKIEHKVVCAVISGHMRHGIRIGQRERSSIYDVEELYGQCGEVCLGGSPTEVEFELQLKVQAPSPCGICRCSLAVLQPEGANSEPPEQPAEALLEVSFDASAEEHLHFYISSSYFDSNSTYNVASACAPCSARAWTLLCPDQVALNWVLRPGELLLA
ncbi:BTBD2 [Symbiodinium natans]|uniref:BTBD2 protein n=1 Tax=Symbiodinium natans TaxID=878477 RepID=A0A812TBV3_9DINO|nr:BTBD2 [Symbiodinium natans]